MFEGQEEDEEDPPILGLKGGIVILGILTLLSNLHVAIALAHQISSVILVLSALNLYYSVIK